MFLVGVISENKEIVKILKRSFKIEDADIIDLNLDIIENFKNVKFDIVLIANSIKHKRNNKIHLNASIYLINIDIKENLKMLDVLQGIVITYGFNSKASITASSVDDNNISICVQRVIEDINNKKIEPIEFVEDIEKMKNIEISDVIGVKMIEVLLAKKKN